MIFDTPVTLTGPLRSPRQMLDEQEYDGHTSVHDEVTASSLGLTGAPIEGPTHFSQVDPLAALAWGQAWFERGCISAHFSTMVVEGEQVQASLRTTGRASGRVDAAKADGTPVLTGTASVGPEHPTTELDERRARLREPGELFVLDQLEVGMRSSDGDVVVMEHDEHNGPLYPFSLAQKVAQMTEPHPWYTPAGGASSPWGGAVVPMEMISVLALKSGSRLPVRTPSVGLFLDLEVRLHDGPVMVGRPYVVGREVVGLGQSRRTESHWLSTTLSDAGTGALTATVLLHSGVFKESYPGYPADRLG